MLIGMARGIPGGMIRKGNWRVRRTLLPFFLVMYSAIPFFLKKCDVFVTTSVCLGVCVGERVDGWGGGGGGGGVGLTLGHLAL